MCPFFNVTRNITNAARDEYYPEQRYLLIITNDKAIPTLYFGCRNIRIKELRYSTTFGSDLWFANAQLLPAHNT